MFFCQKFLVCKTVSWEKNKKILSKKKSSMEDDLDLFGGLRAELI